MCRFYGFQSNEFTKVECSLVHAQNALLHQSRSDLRGEAHPDGWGIVCYRDSQLQPERRATAAHEDIWFSVAAERTYSKMVIAHIRKATVGKPSVENTHPFTHGCWTFAHNGTVAGFGEIQSDLEQETEQDLLTHRKGTTDSELMFYWLLTRMSRAGLTVEQPCADLSHVVDIVSRSVAHLDKLSSRAAPSKTPKLNLLLTDGHLLLAVRWNHTLFWVERQGIHDCEICGIPHVRHRLGTDYHALIIASEPITHEDWREVPNRTVVAARSADEVNLYPIPADKSERGIRG
jgi:glutamine amidotransferase